MSNRYESIIYSKEDQKILDSTLLANSEKEMIGNLKLSLKDKAYLSVIEDLYKFSKNNYTTSHIAEIFKVSTRQIQIIFKNLGINRDKIKAQRISASNRDNEKMNSLYRKTMLQRLSENQLSSSLLEDQIRHELSLILGQALPNCEIVIGINAINVTNSESDIPIIIIDNNFLYKYIIEIKEDNSKKSEQLKIRDKSKNSKAYYKGYTLLRINAKSYYTSKAEPKLKYEKEIKEKIIEIVNYIVTEVSDLISVLKLQ